MMVFFIIATNLFPTIALNTTRPFQYKIAESPIPSAEEESSSEDEEDGPRKPKVDPDDPVARKSNVKIFLEVAAVGMETNMRTIVSVYSS